MVPSLVVVSCHSCSGEDALTTPAPANSRTWRRSITPQRIATAHSPLPAASHQPTMPPNTPRSNGSSSPIRRLATSVGKPHSAGVGCRRQANVSADCSACSWPSIRVARCHSLLVANSDGCAGMTRRSHSGASCRRICSMTRRCSWRSLAEASRRSAAASSASMSRWRRAEPASGCVSTCRPSLRSSSSGLAPTSTPPSGSPTQK